MEEKGIVWTQWTQYQPRIDPDPDFFGLCPASRSQDHPLNLQLGQLAALEMLLLNAELWR